MSLTSRTTSITVALAAAIGLSACGKKETPPTEVPAPNTASAASAASAIPKITPTNFLIHPNGFQYGVVFTVPNPNGQGKCLIAHTDSNAGGVAINCPTYVPQ